MAHLGGSCREPVFKGGHDITIAWERLLTALAGSYSIL
jgi:hypothetical protein